MKWKVLVADPVAQDGIDILKAEASVDVKTGLKPEELIEIIGDYDALVVRSQTKVTADIIQAAKKLQVVGRAGIGVDNIDLEEATKHGIVVVNAPEGNFISTAEHAIALLMALARHIPQACAKLKAGQWAKKELMGTELHDKTLGIIGMGRVGSQVARVATGLRMKIIAHDPFISASKAQQLGVELVSFKELLKRSDFITLHVPKSHEDRPLIGEAELKLVKPTLRIVNAARGGVIDEEALRKAIDEGRVAGAALDVYTKEPAIDNDLLKSDKVIGTPHLGASTTEAQSNVAVGVAEQILAVLNGKFALHSVNIPVMAPETASAITPFLGVAADVGKLCAQLADGHPNTLSIDYEGEIAEYDTSALKAAVLGGLLDSFIEERVNLVNASVIADERGLKVVEQKTTKCENYTNLVSVEVVTDAGTIMVAGTLMRGQTHIVRIDQYWLDIVPSGNYWLFSDHLDRPGLIGSVGMVTGNADININSMQVCRLEPRGRALMVLGLDAKLTEDQLKQLLAIPDVYSAKVVKL